MSDTSGFRLPQGFHSPLGRLFGSLASWFLFALCFSLLLISMMEVLGMGGFCASGGPYVIAHECSDAVGLFAPMSIYGGLFAVAIALLLSDGFGVALVALAWPILFCGLGTGFFVGFVMTRDLTPLFLGIMFWVMGAAPLAVTLRNRPQAVVLGSANLSGEFFASNDRGGFAMLPSQTVSGTVTATPGSWVLSIACCVIPAALGWMTAVAWFASFGGQ